MSRLLLLTAMIVTTAACRTDLNVGSQGVTGTAACNDLKMQANNFASAHRSCTQASDCDVLPGCGFGETVYIDKSAATQMAALEDQWIMQCNPPPAGSTGMCAGGVVFPPACNNGVCGAAAASGQSCDTLKADANNFATAHQACNQDSDCTTAGSCGEVGNTGCVTYVNQQGQSALQTLVNQWAAQCAPGGGVGPCSCPAIFAAKCNQGTCGAAAH